MEMTLKSDLDYNVLICWCVVPKRCQEIMQIKIRHTKTTDLRCFEQ